MSLEKLEKRIEKLEKQADKNTIWRQFTQSILVLSLMIGLSIWVIFYF